MFDFNGDGIMDPGEEYLVFRIWEEECLVEEEEEEEEEFPDRMDGEDGL